MAADAFPAMPRTTLGRTGIKTSKLCLGAWGFGTASAPSAQVGGDDETLIEILQLAFDAGIRILDSAEAYANEDRIGRLLKDVDTPDDLTIVTKFGHGKGFTADQFRASAEKTLTDLDIDRIPIMMVHDPRNDDDMAIVMGKGGALEGLRQLQDEGIVGYIGMATGTLPPLLQAVESGEFDCIQFPRLYTLLNKAAKTSGLLAKAKAKNIATLAAAPFTGNILATGAVDGALYCYRPALPEVLEAVRKMEAACKEAGVTIAEAALAFTLTEPLVDVGVIGVTRAQELRWNLNALQIPLQRHELEAIAELGEVDPVLLGGPDFVKAFPADYDPGPLR